MTLFSQPEYARRADSLRRLLIALQIDLAILSQPSDIAYACGSSQPVYLFATAAGEAVMLARKAADRARNEAPYTKLAKFGGTSDLLRILGDIGAGDARRVGFTLDTLSYSSVVRLQRLLPDAEIVDISWDLRKLRMVKSEEEIALQASAGEIMAGIPIVIRQSLGPGVTELELSAAIEDYLRRSGHGAFMPGASRRDRDDRIRSMFQRGQQPGRDQVRRSLRRRGHFSGISVRCEYRIRLFKVLQ